MINRRSLIVLLLYELDTSQLQIKTTEAVERIQI